MRVPFLDWVLHLDSSRHLRERSKVLPAWHITWRCLNPYTFNHLITWEELIACYGNFPCGSIGKELACYAGDLGSIPGLGRFPGEGKGYPLQYSCLENSMDFIVYSVVQFSSVHSLSHVWLFVTPWTVALQASLSITNSQSLLKLMSIASVILPTISSSVIPFSSCLQSFPASGSFQMSQLFASGGKVLEFQLQHQSFQWIFKTDFL